MKFYELISNKELFASYKQKDLIELECDYCLGLYKRTKRVIQQKACATKINKCFCSMICYRKGIAEANRKPIEVICNACQKTIVKNPVLVSRNKTGIYSCSEHCRYINKLKYCKRTCKNCFAKFKYEKGVSTKRKCENCTVNYEKYKSLTIQQYKSLNGKELSRVNLRARIAGFCRKWNAHLLSNPCQVCKYSTITELAHIVPVSEHIKLNSTLGDVNSSDNLLVLCPNHHAEFDRGLIKLADIPLREGQETSSHHSNNYTLAHDSTNNHEPY